MVGAGVDRLMDRVVDAIIPDRINAAEFWIAFIEPPGGAGRTGVDPRLREKLRRWLKNHPEPHTDENTTEWGKGDAPLREVLELMNKEKYAFAACMEYEYPGGERQSRR